MVFVAFASPRALSMLGRASRVARVVSLILFLVVFGGCAGAGDAPRDVSAPTAQSYEPLSGDVWRPKQPITPVQMTAEEASDHRRAMLKYAAEQWGIEPATTPDLVRWVTYEESTPVTARCMEEKGFTVEWASDGLSYTITGLGAQETSAYQADYECLAMYSPDPRLDVLTPQRLGLEWDYYHEWVLPCLAEQGVKELVPLPSREVYVATQGKWDGYPFGHPGLVTACRPSPPSLALLGVPY